MAKQVFREILLAFDSFFSFSSFLLLLLLLFFSRQRRVSSRHYHHDRKHYATIAIRFLVTCSRKLKSAFSNGMEGGRLAAGSMETSRRYLRTLTRYACRSKSRSNRIFQFNLLNKANFCFLKQDATPVDRNFTVNYRHSKLVPTS